MRSQLRVEQDHCTFGAEHELADWNALKPLPEGFQRSPDHTIVNSNGVAAQPKTSVYGFGGEFNTPPTRFWAEQVDCLNRLRAAYPNATVNHRSNLHIHVRVPGLKESLEDLKQIQLYIHEQLPKVLGQLEPIPAGKTPAEKKRARRRKVSHQTFLTKTRLDHQLAASNLQEFFEREVPRSKTGAVMWHAQPRVCVNLRQLLQTDTVEFRHFPGTLDELELGACLQWCFEFLQSAIAEKPLQVSSWPFPRFPPFNEAREIGYQATASHNGVPPTEIAANIRLILTGKFNERDSPEAYRAAAERAGALPR